MTLLRFITFAAIAGAALGAAPLTPQSLRYVRDLELDLVRPDEAKTPGPHPLAIFVHGCGWVSGSRKDYGDMPTQFARSGFVAASIDYHLTTTHFWPSQAVEVREAIWWMRRHAAEFGGDPNRLLLIGHSAGGQLVAWSATQDTKSADGFASRPNAVLAISGIYDLRAQSGPEKIHPLLRAYLESTDPRAASPLFHFDSGTAPILFIHGDADDTVPVEQARAAFAALTKFQPKAQLLVLPGEGHGFTNKESFDQVREASFAFFRATGIW